MPDYTRPTAQSSRRLSLSSNAGSVTSEAPRQNGYRVPSNGPRPGTSQSVRPDSSMSVRGPAPPIVVKKTRAPTQPRPEPAKSSRVRRKSPLNEGSTILGNNDKTTDPLSRSSSLTIPSTAPSTAQSSDIDNLTSGMKRVKISLTTKSQREAKLGAKAAATKAPTNVAPAVKATGPQPTRKVSARKESVILPPLRQATPTAQTNGMSAPPQPRAEPETIPAMPPTPQPSLPAHLPTHLQQATSVPLPASSPAAPRYTAPELSPAPPPPTQENGPTYNPIPVPGPDIFIPYQPEGPPPPTITNQEPLRWLPPNTATPSPMKKGDLPVFSSTGAIPFGLPGVNRGMNGMGKQEMGGEGKRDVGGEERRDVEGDIWEFPETPDAKGRGY